MTDSNNISKLLLSHYDGKLSQFGDSAEAMDWRDENEQNLRFRSFIRSIAPQVFSPLNRPELPAPTLLDVGCGTGHFFEYLKALNLTSVIEYSGTDINQEMIKLARDKFPGVPFETADFLKKPGSRQYDHLISNGILTLKTPEVTEAAFWSFAQELMDQMWKLCRQSIALNFITKHVEWEVPTLFHIAPERVLSFAKSRYTSNVAILHDYNLYEFIVVIKK